MTTIDSLFQAKTPAIPQRIVHIDLKGVPPTIDRLIELTDIFATCRYTGILVEWEDMFPWTVDEKFRSPTAYSPDDVQRFLAEAKEHGLIVIPLVQCLGHMETPLSLPRYKHLRETPYDGEVLNATASGGRELVQSMVDDVLGAFDGFETPYFHMGGDEAWTMGRHPDSAAYIEKHSKAELYLQHIEPIIDSLNARGIRPLLWYDMMREWDKPAKQRLGEKADLVAWGYGGHPDDHTAANQIGSTNSIEPFHEGGVPLWGSGAYKGADGHNRDHPDYENRQVNALGWMDIHKRFDFKGIIITAWSRYSVSRIQVEPIEGALDTMINLAVILHDGKAVPREVVIDAIGSLGEGEKERFEKCWNALEEIQKHRFYTWEAIAAMSEAIYAATHDCKRRESRVLHHYLESVNGNMGVNEDHAVILKETLAGRMQQRWVDSYINERLEPLRQRIAELGRIVRDIKGP